MIAMAEDIVAIADGIDDIVSSDASMKSRATALGCALRRNPAVEVVASANGSAIYRLLDLA